MTNYWGVSTTAWAAWTAIGTIALAAATSAAIFVALHIAKRDRERDDAKRTEDRQREDELRRQDATEWDRRTNAERRDREDYDARQVTVDARPQRPPLGSFGPGHDFNHRIVVRSPAVYPIKQLTVQIAGRAGTGLTIQPTGHSGEPPVVENGSTVYRYWAEISELLTDPAPIIRFVDRHGNLYYQYKGHTDRFPHITDFPAAATTIQSWINSGPKPDESLS